MATRKKARGSAPKRPTKAEREQAAIRKAANEKRAERRAAKKREEEAASRKRSKTAAKAAATRKANRIAAEAEAERARRAAARKKRPKARPTSTVRPAPKARPAAKAQTRHRPTAAPPKKRKRTPRERAEAARLGWERRREREAIQAEGEGGLPDFSKWPQIYPQRFGIRKPSTAEQLAYHRAAIAALEPKDPLEETEKDRLRRRLADVPLIDLDRTIEHLLDDGDFDFDRAEIYDLFYSPDAA